MNIRDHLLQRHLDLELHRPVLDLESNIATFYLYNLSGQIVGYQKYNPSADKVKNNHPSDGRYYTYRNKTTLSIFGVESLHLTPGLLFVTEGIFDAARMTEIGYSAVAVLSNNPTPDIKNWFTCLNRKIIVIADSDSAGRKLAKFGDYVEYCVDHDLGDSTQEFVNNLGKKYG